MYNMTIFKFPKWDNLEIQAVWPVEVALVKAKVGTSVQLRSLLDNLVCLYVQVVVDNIQMYVHVPIGLQLKTLDSKPIRMSVVIIW